VVARGASDRADAAAEGGVSPSVVAWTVWNVSPTLVVVELDDRLTPRGCALELELLLDARGVRRATWRLEDGRAVRRAVVGLA
jgi:hypothetical protein